MKMLLPVLLMLATGKTILPGEVKVKTLPPESREVLDYLPRNIVIAHRGTTYWAPEETEAAMRWARNIGADYLELDLQRTKDGVLIALHDVNLRRTTNVETVFPDRADSPVSEFTLEELRQLDAGSWFNKANPDRARKAFEGLDILTLEDCTISTGRGESTPVTKKILTITVIVPVFIPKPKNLICFRVWKKIW